MRVVTSQTTLAFTASADQPWEAGRPTILGLHGGPGIDGAQLRYFLRPQQQWSTVIVPDQRGHGLSELSDPAHWNLQQWADDVRSFIDALNLRDVVLLGTSFGGFVVQKFMSAHPGAVMGGVIVGSSPRRASMDEIVDRYRAVGGDEPAQVMQRVMTSPSLEAEEDWSRVCSPLSRMRPPDSKLSHIIESQIKSPQVNEHFTRTLGDLDLRPELAAVREPILVLVGQLDPLVPPQVASELVAHSGGPVTFVEVKDASHQVLWDQAEESDRLLRQFVAELNSEHAGARRQD